ncbi:MAG: phosphatase PAP2 family protein, partial [Acetobacteraceae bacterium]|nr:phosphatase PAP2 family protein [Acetobacteraceae bacterium]
MALLGNGFVGLSWQPSTLQIFGPSLLLLAVAAYSAHHRILLGAEISFYLSLWFLSSILAVRLTYLAFTVGFPLQDRWLMTVDAALGFNWVSWSLWSEAHPITYYLQGLAYQSLSIQSLFVVTASAIARPRVRNAETFVAVSIASFVTAAVAILVPAIGPGDTLGLRIDLGPVVPVVASLRAGATAHVLPYVGIVAFPSFHT